MLSEYSSTLLHRLTNRLLVMDNAVTMGQRLTLAREAAGLSRPQLAKKVGLTRAAVNQWEADAVKGIKPENLLNVCEVLKIEPWWLVFGEGPQEASSHAGSRKRESRWLGVASALSTERGDELLSYLESRIALEKAGLLPASISEE